MENETFDTLGQQARKVEALALMTGSVAEGFNEVLAIIQSKKDVLDLLVSDNEEATAHLSELEAAVDRGVAVTSRLLAYSREHVVSSNPVDLNDLVSELADDLRNRLSDGITLKLDIGDEPCISNVDKRQLELVMSGLMENALDAVDEGGAIGVSVEKVEFDDEFVRTHKGARKGQYLKIEIVDDGTGMPSYIAKKAMEPFFTTKEEGVGTGLGLSIAYSFAKQFFGYFELESDQGMGTSVKIYLPQHYMNFSI